MKEPRRLLHDDPGFARLVDAVRNDRPSELQMGNALSIANVVASRGAGSIWLGRSSTHVGLTIVGMTVLLGALSISSTTSSKHDGPAKTISPTLTVARTNPASVVMPSELATTSVRVDELPSAPRAPVAPAIRVLARSKAETLASASQEVRQDPVAPCSGAPCAPAPLTFSEQLALTSEARAALKRGDIVSCLAAVDRYRNTFRTGVFSQEIDVIGIEALAKSGARERARAAAEQFLVMNASSPYVDRVHSVLENNAK